MSDKTPTPFQAPTDAVGPDLSTEGAVSRRRLMRAGLAAAPVLASLYSAPVLATTKYHIRPSSFSSLTANHGFVSRGRALPASHFNFESVEVWKAKYKTKTDSSGRVIVDISDPNTYLLNTRISNYVPSSGVKLSMTDGRNFYRVLTQGNSKEKQAAALYLTAATDPTQSLLTTKQAADYWTHGFFAPFTSQTAANDYVNAMFAGGVQLPSKI